jgi:hypothetical protein
MQILEDWQLSERETAAVLGMPSQAALQLANQNEAVELHDISAFDIRLGLILGIQQALSVRYGDQSRANSWVRSFDSAALFNGHRALDLMTGRGLAGLMLVRHFLRNDDLRSA